MPYLDLNGWFVFSPIVQPRHLHFLIKRQRPHYAPPISACREALSSHTTTTMSDPTYPLFPIFAFLGILFSLVPLPWHLQAWNSGTCYFIFWTSFACLNQFVNSVVWAGSVRNPSPWWCEICQHVLHFEHELRLTS